MGRFRGAEEVRAENGASRSLRCLPAYSIVVGTGNQEGFMEDMLYLGFRERQQQGGKRTGSPVQLLWIT